MVFHPVELRIQALTPLAWGVLQKEIAASLGLSPRTMQDIFKRAKARGFDPAQDMSIRMEYVEDAKRSGRRKKNPEGVENAVIQSVS